MSWLTEAFLYVGKDQYHPLSQTGSQMSPEGLGWIIIDSLDTSQSAIFPYHDILDTDSMPLFFF